MFLQPVSIVRIFPPALFSPCPWLHTNKIHLPTLPPQTRQSCDAHGPSPLPLVTHIHWAFMCSSFIIRSAYFVCKPPTRQDLHIDLVHSRCNLWSVCWPLFRNHFFLSQLWRAHVECVQFQRLSNAVAVKASSTAARSTRRPTGRRTKRLARQFRWEGDFLTIPLPSHYPTSSFSYTMTLS